MAKTKGPKTNFHVEVYPDTQYLRHDQEYQEVCNDIVNQINRHVDRITLARVVYDQKDICEFCGYGWTETSPIYNGGCCDKDEANNPNPTGDS